MKLIKSLVILIIFLTFGCKDKLQYKYLEKESLFICNESPINTDLIKEALYSFEDDIIKYHGAKESQLKQVYISFLYRVKGKSFDYKKTASEHTMKILAKLKEENELWKLDSKKSFLNYNNPILKCIGSNINNEDLKKTFNALISVNGMNQDVFTTPLTSNYDSLISDKALRLYVALDLYYAQLSSIDSPNYKQIKKNKEQEDHSDHNH